MTETGNSATGWRDYLNSDTVSSTRQATAQRVYWGLRAFIGNPLAVFGLVVILVMIAAAILAPVIATHEPNVQDLNRALQPPSGANWLGTDELGRDIYSRIVYGSRISIYIVILVSVIVAPVGLLVGMAAGYFGGWVDRVLMRITDIFLSFPSLILALAFAAALGPGIENAVIAISLTAWPSIARLARAETLTMRASDFIAAAQVSGASAFRILRRHILPICVPSVIVRITLNMAGVLLTAAGLGFLGLGAQPPTPEWGAMTSAGRRFMIDSWWVVTMPGLAILVVALAFNLFGDGLRDVLDPRQSR
ncbi:MAG TPA: ABC transporter permease [Devosia sp.]|nr:ABC transporter permease [Devosia sp.]